MPPPGNTFEKEKKNKKRTDRTALDDFDRERRRERHRFSRSSSSSSSSSSSLCEELVFTVVVVVVCWIKFSYISKTTDYIYLMLHERVPLCGKDRSIETLSLFLCFERARNRGWSFNLNRHVTLFFFFFASQNLHLTERIYDLVHGDDVFVVLIFFSLLMICSPVVVVVFAASFASRRLRR